MNRQVTTLLLLCVAASPAVTDTAGASRYDPEGVSSARNDYSFQTSGDGHLRLFARGRADFSDSRILVSQAVDGGWTRPQPIVFSDERFKDSDPWLSRDGQVLYFISNRSPAADPSEPQDRGTYDIWRSRYTDGAWIAPEHLGGINSKANEFGPMVRDGFLYFGSNRSGDYDIYRVRLDGASASGPEPLPAPINSESVDNDFVLSPDGRLAVWSSGRPGGHGRADLYVARRDGAKWTRAENLGPGVNSEAAEFTPRFSPDGAHLYFASTRQWPGQDEGAADVYQIAVQDVPALQAPMSTFALERLQTAFGGKAALSGIRSISFTLESQSLEGAPERADYQLHLASEAVVVHARHGKRQEVTYVRADQGERHVDGTATAVDPDERRQLLEFLHLNFLYFLARTDVVLKGPLETGHRGDLAWYRLSAGGLDSPPLGLDLETGRIVKTAASDETEVLELDYMRTPSGVVWPHRFIVRSGGRVERQGRFSNLQVNVSLPENAPAWLRH